VQRRAQRELGHTLAAGWICVFIGVAGAANASSLTVKVTDATGAPVSDVAVYATPERTIGQPAEARREAVMDQSEQRFIPHVLIIETGTAVEFPNHDTVRHHVYSFSDAMTFELSLYEGREHAPIVFANPGIVDVGCNIHDSMEAHIVVVDTPYFAVSDDAGRAVIDALPSGEYSIAIYTPRLAPKSQPAARAVSIATAAAQLDVQIEPRLRPPHSTTNESLEWSSY